MCGDTEHPKHPAWRHDGRQVEEQEPQTAPTLQRPGVSREVPGRSGAQSSLPSPPVLPFGATPECTEGLNRLGAEGPRPVGLGELHEVRGLGRPPEQPPDRGYQPPQRFVFSGPGISGPSLSSTISLGLRFTQVQPAARLHPGPLQRQRGPSPSRGLGDGSGSACARGPEMEAGRSDRPALSVRQEPARSGLTAPI